MLLHRVYILRNGGDIASLIHRGSGMHTTTETVFLLLIHLEILVRLITYLLLNWS